MKNRPFTAVRLAGALAALLLVHAVPALAADVHVAPESMRVDRGEASRRSTVSLRRADQRGTVDTWSRYVEFSTSSRGFRADFEFSLPLDLVGESLRSMKLFTSFRGPERREQLWRWSLRDATSGRWVRVGDNRGIPDWRWTRKRFTAPGEAANYIDALGRVRVRLYSPRPGDDSNLDALAIEIDRAIPVAVAPTAQTPAPEPAPTASPTPTPAPIPAPVPAAPAPEEPPASSADTGRWQPAPGTSWQIQFTGSLDTSLDVDMYDIDLFDTPASTIEAMHRAGRKVVCYFSAGSYEDWRPDASRFASGVLGQPLSGWPGERWLDIRRLDLLMPIMEARMELAVTKGCDAVDPDNVDGYTNPTGLPLGAADQLRYNKALATAAHARGLSIGLKNDLSQVRALEPYFDFAVNESCVYYEECARLTPFVAAGKAVFGIEYRGDAGAVCSRANALDFDTLLKDRSLGARRNPCR